MAVADSGPGATCCQLGPARIFVSKSMVPEGWSYSEADARGGRGVDERIWGGKLGHEDLKHREKIPCLLPNYRPSIYKLESCTLMPIYS